MYLTDHFQNLYLMASVITEHVFNVVILKNGVVVLDTNSKNNI